MNCRIFHRVEKYSPFQISIVLFFLSFGLRFSYSIYAYFSNIMESFADDKGYFYLANEIVKKGDLLYDKDIHLYGELIGPGLPWINSLTILLLGENWLGIFLVTSIVSSLIPVFIFKVSLLVADKRTALLAAIWSCFYFFYIYFSPTSGKDIWMAFFMIFLVYMLLLLFHEGKFTYPGLILFIVIYVFSFHLDERYLVFAPFILGYITFSETNAFTKASFNKSFIFIGLTMIFMIPWTIRNYNEFGKIIIISTRTERFTDSFLGYDKKGHVLDRYDDVYGYYYIKDYQIDSVIAGTKKVTDGGYKISKEQRKAMIDGNLPHPLTKSEAFWIRTKEMFRIFQLKGEYQRTGYFYYEMSLKHNITSFGFYGIMFLFSLPGFFYLFKRRRYAFILFFSIILIYGLLHSLLIPYTNWRYRLPLDSLLIIVGSIGISYIYSLINNKLRNVKLISKQSTH